MMVEQAQEVADGTPLLTTLVQSGAALVAIIAGLLVARLVALAGERVALERRVRELEEIERARKDELTAARENRLNNDADYFIRCLFGEYLKNRGRTFESLYGEFNDGVRTTEELKPYFEEFQADVERVEREIGARELAKGSEPPGWKSKRNALAAPFLARDRDIVYGLLNLVEKKWQTQSGPEWALLESFEPYVAAVSDPLYEQSIRDDESEAEVALKATRMEISQSRRALDTVSRPQGLALTLIALGVVTIASVIVPLVQLTFGKPFLTVGERAGFVGVFMLSLLVFFAYLGYEMWRIMRRR